MSYRATPPTVAPAAGTIEDLTDPPLAKPRLDADPMTQPPALVDENPFVLHLAIPSGQEAEFRAALRDTVSTRFRFIKRTPDIVEQHARGFIETLERFHIDDPMAFASGILLDDVERRIEAGQSWAEATVSINAFMARLLALRVKAQ